MREVGRKRERETEREKMYTEDAASEIERTVSLVCSERSNR